MSITSCQPRGSSLQRWFLGARHKEAAGHGHLSKEDKRVLLEECQTSCGIRDWILQAFSCVCSSVNKMPFYTMNVDVNSSYIYIYRQITRSIMIFLVLYSVSHCNFICVSLYIYIYVCPEGGPIVSHVAFTGLPKPSYIYIYH